MTLLRDNDGPRLEGQQREEARAFAQRSVDEIKLKVFPIHGL